MSLEFSPLYWIYHDCWRYRETTATSPKPSARDYFHAGHIHLFLMDFNPLKQASQQAFSGTQTYSFEIEDVWGPNSKNQSQITSYKLVGKPRWYFQIKEHWRRMYIQPWDIEDYSLKMPNHPHRIGIRWDASKECHTLGPFREGRGLYFFNPSLNRTLPVEYWLNNEKQTREHFLRKTHYQKDNGESYSWDETPGGETWSFEDGCSEGPMEEGIPYSKTDRTWSRKGKGIYWSGDNVRSSGEFFKNGDIVLHGKDSLTGNSKFFRNEYVAVSPTSFHGAGYYPNPTPGASESSLRMEYLRYMGMNWRYESSSNGYGYGEKYVVEYGRWKMEKDGSGRPIHTGTEGELFNEFIEMKQDEFTKNSFGGYPEGWGYVEPVQFDQLQLDLVSFYDFCHVWRRLTDDEIRSLGLMGSYPTKKPDAEISSNPYDETYHKNREEISPFDVYKQVYSHRDVYTIPRDSWALGDSPQSPNVFPDFVSSFSDEDGARRMYSDNLYISPIIEYQSVYQLGGEDGSYERLPAAASADSGIDIFTDQSGAFGDGFSVTVEIPFKINGVMQSPFSDDKRKVYPIGQYFHGKVKDKDKFGYSMETYGEEADVASLEKYEEALGKWRVEKAEAEARGEVFLKPEPEGPFSKVKRYRLSEYTAEIESGDTMQQMVDWFNSNYANRPITQNMNEGEFDQHSLWIPVTTNDRPMDSQMVMDEHGRPVTSPRKNIEWSLKGYREDGQWVEQCLGATVKAAVELVFEDSLGHRWTEWVRAVEASPSTGFIGTKES